MSKFHLSPTNLRVMLSIGMFLIIAVAAILAGISYTGLRQVAVDVSHTTLDANASQNNLRTLQQVKEKLEEEKDIVERANSIVAESQSYQYQDQILADLNGYAARSGVTITNIDFSSTTTTTPTTPATPALPTPAGVKSRSISVTLKNPIDYNSLLRFLNSIEQNLTKMQISKVSLATDESTGGVSTEALTIEVYVR
jgi:type II secretory pathway pseudopilin PulG